MSKLLTIYHIWAMMEAFYPDLWLTTKIRATDKRFQETHSALSHCPWPTPLANTAGHERLCQQPRKTSEDIGSLQLFLLVDFPGLSILPTHVVSQSVSLSERERMGQLSFPGIKVHV